MRLIAKAWKEPAFREELVKDPRGTFEKYTTGKLPEQLKIYIHEEDANTLHLTVPAVPSNVSELSDEDLQKVAGGTDLFMTAVVGIGAAVGLAVTGGVISGAVAGKNAGW
jgi:hypothetical protein